MRLALSLCSVLALGCGKSSGTPKVAPSDGPEAKALPPTPAVVAPQVDAGAVDLATTDTANDTDAANDTDTANVAPEDLHCKRQPFASSIPIAEASGATWMPDTSLLVIGDSGTDGAFLRLSSADGSVLTKGKLPLDSGASDDLEGLSRIGSTLFGITSSGYMREWEPKGDTFVLARKSYSIARKGDTKSVCASAKDSNCGPNYEGLCLLDTAADAKPSDDAPCVGYAAAKARGSLVCLVRRPDGRLAARPEHTISVANPKTLSGCHFDPQGRLWFGNNVFAANTVGLIEDHQHVKSAKITRVGALGLGFAEAIAVGTGGQVFRFSDTTGSPSLLDKYICR
tara:strand:+ start:44423 stop:45445 length:1023 start_codon:yes stop_codon:yes gene_type:complete